MNGTTHRRAPATARRQPVLRRLMNAALICSAMLGTINLSASASVNLKNGNFYISYTDIEVGAGKNKIEITRTYNSKSVGIGMFGFGWGSDFETRLELSQDGGIVIHEHGEGGKTSFDRKGYSDKERDDRLNTFIGALASKSIVPSPAARDDLFQTLKENRELANAHYLSLESVSGPPPENLFGGKDAVFASTQRGQQTLLRDDNGYTRISADGASERFDAQGHLVFSFKGGNTTRIIRDNAGRIARLTSGGEGETLIFNYNDNGQVIRVENPETQARADYRYVGDNLVWSRDAGGNVYSYAYDTHHNLVSITYSDQSQTQIAYHPGTLYVAQVTDRSGEETSYDYYTTPVEAFAALRSVDNHPIVDQYGTRVTKRGFDGQPATNSYDYQIAAKATGERYTSRIVTDINGIKTETSYNSTSSLPVVIARGKLVTKFRYNERDLLVEKSSTRGDFTRLSYHDGIDKIKRVENNDGVFDYEYDVAGNLTTARHAGRLISLVYDVRGRIATMTDRGESGSRRTLAFQYNELGKPTAIELVGIGRVDVLYDDRGEIRSVNSEAGQKMALEITQAFQTLLSIVSPSGVNLNM
jgi:YD repeat-containing protein